MLLKSVFPYLELVHSAFIVLLFVHIPYFTILCLTGWLPTLSSSLCYLLSVALQQSISSLYRFSCRNCTDLSCRKIQKRIIEAQGHFYLKFTWLLSKRAPPDLMTISSCWGHEFLYKRTSTWYCPNFSFANHIDASWHFIFIFISLFVCETEHLFIYFSAIQDPLL